MSNPLFHGVVTKLVHVGARQAQRAEQGLYGQGYGLLRGDQGREYYFVDTAVVADAFKLLQLGDEVMYQPEDGPFYRAAQVALIMSRNAEGAVR